VRLPLTDDDLSKIDLPLAFVAKDKASAPDVNLSAIVAGKRRNWAGKIMRTDSTYDTQTRALFAIAEVFDPYGDGASENGVPLAPGLFVDAAVEGKIYESVIVLPRDGLRPGNKVYVVDDKGKSEIRDVSVIDTDVDRAILSSGVEPGELIILSPMEESRTAMTLKVLDVNDPKTVLVDPPKPQWLIDKEKADAEGGDDKKKKRQRRGKGDPDAKPKKKSDKDEGENAAGAGDKSSADGGNN